MVHAHANGNSNLPATNIDTPPKTFIRHHLFIIIVVSILALSGIAIFIAWLATLPHKPNFAVNSLSLSNFSVSQTQLKGNSSNILMISIVNTNKNAYLVLETFNVYLYHHETELAVATVESPIYLESMSLIEMKAELGGGGEFSTSKVVEIKEGEIENPKPWEQNENMLKLWTIGNGNFVLKISVRGRFKYLYQMLTRRVNLDVHCGITDMHFSTEHEMWNVSGLGFCDG